MSDNVAIGIDLGTTFSCVGVLRNGKVDIIANDYGSRITPSWVAFTDEECLSGEAAKAQACVNPWNTVFEIKRLIGRRFRDITVQNDIRHWPFEVFDDRGYPKIRLQHKMKELVLTPEQASSMILTKMRYVAESYLGQEIRDAVITVPAYFNDSQRQATKDAGKIAGLNVLHILNEPTAAAIAYGFDKNVLLNQRLLVFDLGGGTLDVAVLSISNKEFKVAAVGGDTHLGGGDFDSRLVHYFVNKIKLLHGRDLTQSPKALIRLRNACEKAKIKLSSALKANIDIACLYDGNDFQVTITRKRLEDLCSDLFSKIIEHVECVVSDSGFAKESIQEVILVGGSSHIPKVQEMLQEFFDGKKLSKSINFDEAVAYGASIRAAIASATFTVDEITLAEVVPFSLGMKSCQGEMIPFIKRNSRIPTTVVQDRWTTAKDYADSCIVKVYEGERTLAVNNNFLGSFVFYHGERVVKGVPKLTFTFVVDADGILRVSGENEKTKFKGTVTITSNQGRLSKVEIEHMKLEAQEYGSDDKDCGVAFSSKGNLECFCVDQMAYTREICNRGLISPAQRNFVIKWCEECLRWLRETRLLSKDDYTKKLAELKSRFSPALLLHNQHTEGRKDYQSFKLC